MITWANPWRRIRELEAEVARMTRSVNPRSSSTPTSTTGSRSAPCQTRSRSAHRASRTDATGTRGTGSCRLGASCTASGSAGILRLVSADDEIPPLPGLADVLLPLTLAALVVLVLLVFWASAELGRALEIDDVDDELDA